MPQGRTEGFAESYLRLCQRQGRSITKELTPEAGDWVIGPDGLTLIGDPPRELHDNEVVVPSLTHLLYLLRQEAPSVVIDCYSQDFACMAFDEHGSALANVVSRNPEEAAMRALLFIRAERAQHGMST